MQKIILASASPRRRELLAQIGLEFEIITSDLDESFDNAMSCEDIVKKLAYEKANAVARQVKDSSIIIGADTVVYYNGAILGKPENEAHARSMLMLLSGNTHQVLTGFAIIRPIDNKVAVDYEKTNVTFRQLGDDEIDMYIKTKEPLDKAGAYGIQGLGATFVSSIQGDYNNVVGLPLCSLSQCLKNEFDIKILENT